MSKRFTDTEKWEDIWYRKLKPEEKNFWDFICCQCDNSGVWKADLENAYFHIGCQPIPNILDILNNGKCRVTVLNNGDWFIKDFVLFQYGDNIKNPKIRLHIKKLILKNKDNGYPIDTQCIPDILGMHTPKDKDKEKDKEKEKEKINKEPIVPSGTKEILSYFVSKYENKVGSKYVCNYAKEGKLVKNILSVISVDEAKQRIDRFFDTKDDFIEKAGRTLGVFYSTINKNNISNSAHEFLNKWSSNARK